MATGTVRIPSQTAIQRSGNQPTAIVGPFGHTTTLSVDSNGYLAGIQAPDRAVTSLTYDPTGLMSTLTDPNGNQHQFTFDSSGRLTQDTDPEGDFQALTLTGVNGGTPFAIGYDVDGYVVSAGGPAGALMAETYTRDKLGRVTDTSETTGGTTSAWHYGYDTERL